MHRRQYQLMEPRHNLALRQPIRRQVRFLAHRCECHIGSEIPQADIGRPPIAATDVIAFEVCSSGWTGQE